mgnify:CR=1 FL=1
MPARRDTSSADESKADTRWQSPDRRRQGTRQSQARGPTATRATEAGEGEAQGPEANREQETLRPWADTEGESEAQNNQVQHRDQQAPRGSVREAIARRGEISHQARALEAARCNVYEGWRSTVGAEDLQQHLERLARRPELITLLVMVPESAMVRVLHSPFEYRAPFDAESNKWDGTMFAFMGERLRGHLPTLVQASAAWFKRRQVRLGVWEHLRAYYEEPHNRRRLMPPAEAKGECKMVPRAVQIPREWASKVLRSACTPFKVYEWVRECVREEPQQEREAYTPLEDWCAASCMRRTLTGHEESSMLALALPVATKADEDVVEAAEARLSVTLRLPTVGTERRLPPTAEGTVDKPEPGRREQESRVGQPSTANTDPGDQLSLLARAFMEGATAHKRSSETVTPSASGKFSETQLTQLMGWCGLGPGEQDKLPPIWT